MEIRRKKELSFLVRTNTPIPVVESRTDHMYEQDIYDDFYTLTELVKEKYLEYLGHNNNFFFLRPTANFSVSVLDEVKELESGEIIKLYLTEKGRDEFESWLDTDLL